MSLSFDEMVGDTLAQINLVRVGFGHAPLFELPDARPGDTKDCLYYRGLKDCGVTGVGVNRMTFGSERQAKLVAELWGTESYGHEVHSPQAITRVIGEFDSNRTPHYNT